MRRKYYVIEFDNKNCSSVVYAKYNNIGEAIRVCKELNRKQEGLVPYYQYTVSCKDMILDNLL